MQNEITWTIDQAHSEIYFKATHLMISQVSGTFKTFNASIRTSGKDFTTAVIDLWIDASSLQTNDLNRDEHLRSKDFLDAHHHKQITFTSNTIGEGDSDGNHDLWGELTIRGITHKVKFSVHFGGILNDPYANEKAGFTITGKFNRKDWGLVWNRVVEAGGIMVGEEVTLTCELELINTTYKPSTLEITPNDAEVTL
ncbi:MAG: YceI family protein [Chitinophagaceae bacterium]